MIVGTVFPGDEDDDTKGLQHELYAETVARIHRHCRCVYLIAQDVVGHKTSLGKRIVKLQNIDHRRLQQAHDLMAANWRFQNGRLEPALPFERLTTETANLWRSSVERELNDWTYEAPLLIEAVCDAVAARTEKLAGIAEERLEEMLRDRYAAMWGRESSGRWLPPYVRY